MNEECVFPNAHQCQAKSKRTLQRCKAPSVRGWSVCRFHGAGGGAPVGKKNGAYRHGCFTKEAKETWQAIKRMVRECGY